MRRVLSFLLPFAGVLALLAWGASWVVGETSRRWFERDIEQRAGLAIQSAKESLVRHWRAGDLIKLQGLLRDIARDERIMAAAACGADLSMVARTSEYPRDLSCRDLKRIGLPMAPEAGGFGRLVDLKGGKVFVSTEPISDAGTNLGLVILVHDLSMIERREAAANRFILIVFVVLAIAVAMVTVIVERITWRRWLADMRDLLRGRVRRPEFRPILADVRDLIDRIATEGESGIPGRAWTPAGLKQALQRHLHGERIMIVANREPYIHDRSPDGTVRVLHPASGLVTALEPVMKACSGVWIAHGSGTADRETSDRNGRVMVPPGEGTYTLRRVWLTPDEEKGYYYGYANEGLWPLCHVAHTRPQFRTEDWAAYGKVNAKFAETVAAEADVDDPIVLVQDYHYGLLPALLRKRLPRATIITFWHIPWPNAERFGICPQRDEILNGMLGSSIIGFHTRSHCNNFVESVDRYLETRIDREIQGIAVRGRLTLVRPYPISLEWPPRWMRDALPVSECRARVFADLGLKLDALLGVGIDRLDYTKGVEERLLAVEALLDRHPEYRGRFSFAQLAAPSRTAIERYRRLGESVKGLAARINSRFGSDGYRPVVLLYEHHEPPAVYRFYRAADLCYVSSLHDGMNLVAKEFVAARDDERGVLVLSSFTGAARELTEALVVNPYDVDQAAEAMAAALSMSAAEQGERMRAMRTLLTEFNVYRWAGKMIVDAARLRQRDRLTDRLAGAAETEGA
jgi:trehalose 6-phosphate synthase